MSGRAITEEDHLQDEWYVRAKEQTEESLPAFLKELTDSYSHDYGTICHAVAAAALAAAHAVNRSPQGGITGFQASCVMWEFLQHWLTEYQGKPLRITNYGDLLYPQYENEFTSISQKTLKWVTDQANSLLQEHPDAADSVRDHWRRIIDGYVPFGLVVQDD